MSSFSVILEVFTPSQALSRDEPADGISSQLEPEQRGENDLFSIWQEGQKSMARQAETDEQTLSASPVCHREYLQHAFFGMGCTEISAL